MFKNKNGLQSPEVVILITNKQLIMYDPHKTASSGGAPSHADLSPAHHVYGKKKKILISQQIVIQRRNVWRRSDVSCILQRTGSILHDAPKPRDTRTHRGLSVSKCLRNRDFRLILYPNTPQQSVSSLCTRDGSTSFTAL